MLKELQGLLGSIDTNKLDMANPLAFGCIVDKEDDIILKHMSEDLKKELRQLLKLPYNNFTTSESVANMVNVIIGKAQDLDRKEMMQSLPPVSPKLSSPEFEDTCIMHRIIDSL